MTSSSSGPMLHLERVLPAPRADVFRAAADAALLARWFGPKGFSASSSEFDLRPGGRYRLSMRPPDGTPFHIKGEFRDLQPPSLLAFTFIYEEPDPDDRETLVTLSLEQAGEGTRVVLEHGPFATEARRALHEQGWSDSFDRLDELLRPRR